jgi:hypothetical protein
MFKTKYFFRVHTCKYTLFKSFTQVNHSGCTLKEPTDQRAGLFSLCFFLVFCLFSSASVAFSVVVSVTAVIGQHRAQNWL